LLSQYFGRAASITDTWQGCIDCLGDNIKGLADKVKALEEEQKRIQGSLQSLLSKYFGAPNSSDATVNQCIASLENNIKVHLDAEEDVSQVLTTLKTQHQWGYSHKEDFGC
jgi:hypothetical protein